MKGDFSGLVTCGLLRKDTRKRGEGDASPRTHRVRVQKRGIGEGGFRTRCLHMIGKHTQRKESEGKGGLRQITHQAVS